MNILKQKTLKLLFATVLVGSTSLSANADRFYDNASKLYFETNDDGTTCSVASNTNDDHESDYTEETYAIPSTVTYNGKTYKVTALGSDAFSCCYNLKNVTIPSSVTTIGAGAFQSCSALTSIELPSGVTSIGSSAFNGCEGLTAITIPSGVTTIEDDTFNFCSSLKTITIPENVTSIGEMAFAYCDALKYLTISDSVKTIGDFAFEYCSSLIGVSTTEFTGVSQNVLIIPNSVTSIGQCAFMDCTSLEHLWLGSGLTSIGSMAFYGDNLTSVTSTATKAPKIASSMAFSNNTYAKADLYVPATADQSSYLSSSNFWKNFKSISDGRILTGVNEVSADNVTVKSNGMTIEIVGNEGAVSIYDMSGVEVYNGVERYIEMSVPGVYVVTVNGKSYKVAVK
jgi:hypothetical protein